MKIEEDDIDLMNYKDALKHLAFDPGQSRGRQFEDSGHENCFNQIINGPAIDVMKITSSRTYRGMAGKMQIFPAPTNIHVRTRLSHTEEFRYIARTIAMILGLNSDLCEAIAVLHDTGHTPLGHYGEKYINAILPGGFKHEKFSLVIAQKIERDGKGLNLLYEVLQGALHHSVSDIEKIISQKWPQEYLVGVYSDKISYTFFDCADIIREKFINPKDLPKSLRTFGINRHEQNYTCIKSLVKESAEKGFVSFQNSEKAEVFMGLRDWMHKNVYWRMDNNERSYLKNYLDRAHQKISELEVFKGINPTIPLCLMSDNDIFDLSNGGLKTNSGIYEFLPVLRKYPDLDIQAVDLNW